MKTITGILILMFTLPGLQAQRVCGSQEYKQRLLQNNTAASQSIALAEQQALTTLKNEKQYAHRDTFANELITVPVVVHVVYNTSAQNISDAQIISQIAALNNDFSNQNTDKSNRPEVFNAVAADCRIKFCLAQVGPNNKATSGIIRKQTNISVFTADDAVKTALRGGDNAWDSKKYLNIWVCNLGGRTLGYSSLPGGPADADGVVISFDVFGTVGNVRAPFNKGRTATHEIGHWLGLKHVWGDTDCGDDGVDDTPKQKTYNFGCPVFPHVTDCSPDANGDMFMNYMDFSDDACMNMFTIEQKKRMRAFFATGNVRNSFLASFACDSTLVQSGPVGGDTTTPSSPVTKTDQFKVYPNPAVNDVTVEYKPAADMLTKAFSVYTTTGIKVLTGNIVKEKSNINLSALAAGIYIIKIGDGKSAFATKIFKR